MNQRIIIITYILYMSSCMLAEPSSPPQEPQVWITVLVHGVINPKPHLSFANFIRVLQDQIADSIYTRSVELIRKDTFFHQYHAMQGTGLQLVDMTLIEPGAAASAFATVYEQISMMNRKQSCFNIYYTFGWSGLISPQLRLMEAEIFYHQLVQEVKKYQEQQITPGIRIIAYSHGGHLTLNLGVVHAYLAQDLHIDELILLGLPVIYDTDYLINSSLFESIYHVYSPGDRVQLTDFSSFHLSNRIFKPRADLTIPPKLLQVQLRCKRIARTKTTYTYPLCPRWLIRNADPGHTELFSFGWIHNYRTYVPLYPLPAAAYLGFILQELQQNPQFKEHVIVDIHPFADSMILSSADGTQQHTVPFISEEQRAALAAYVQQYAPHNFTQATFEQRTAQAIAAATLKE